MKGRNATDRVLLWCFGGLVYVLGCAQQVAFAAATVTVQVMNVGTMTWGGCSSGAATRNGSVENYLPVMAPGATYTYTSGNWSGTVTWSTVWNNCGSYTGGFKQGNTVVPDLSGATATVYLRIWPGLSADPGGSGPQWNFQRCYRNNSGVVQDYQLVLGTNVQDTVTLPPGATYCFTYHGANKTNVTFRAVDVVYRQDGTVYRTDYRTVDNAPDTDPDWYDDDDPVPGVQEKPDRGYVAPDVISQDGTNIVFAAGTSDLAKEATLKTGVQALHAVEQQGFQNVVDQLRANQGKLSAVENAISSGFVNVNGNLASINGNASGANTRLDTANSHLAAIKASVNNIDLDTTSLINNTAGIDSRLAGVQGLLTTNNSNQGVMNANLGSINANLSNRLDTANANLSDLKTKGDTGLAHLAAIKASAQAIDSNTGVIGSKVETKANEMINAANANTVDLISQLQTGNSQRNMMTNQNGQLYWLVDGMRITMTNAVNRLDQVKDKVGEVVSAVNANSPNGVLTNINSELVVHRSFHSYASNLWTSMLNIHTNVSGIDTNAFVSAGNAVGATVKAPIDTVRAGLAAVMDDVALPGGADLSVFQVTIGGVTANMNPFNVPGVVDLAAWMRQILLWVCAFVYLAACWNVTEGMVRAASAARQASSAATLPGASTLAAVSMAGAITLAIAAIPAVFAVSVYGSSSLLAVLGGNPLGTGNAAIAAGVWVLDQFIPVVSLFTYAIGYVLFRLQATGVYVLSTTIVRFLVG